MMTSTAASKWIRNIYRVYVISFIAWAAATAVLLGRLVITKPSEGFDLTSPIASVLFMLCALPGLLYFLLQSRAMQHADLAEANTRMNRVMALQNITGIIAVAGAILGFLPFVVNVLGVVGLLFTEPQVIGDPALGDSINGGPAAFAANLGLILPWVSLYGFVATYVAALNINRQRKRAAQQATA